jgi:hypothetical protein
VGGNHDTKPSHWREASWAERIRVPCPGDREHPASKLWR